MSKKEKPKAKNNVIRKYRVSLHQGLSFSVERVIRAASSAEAEDKMYEMLENGELDAEWNDPVCNNECTTVALCDD